MSLIGKWRNQRGSVLEITDDTNGRVIGTFCTAHKDSGFGVRSIPIVGARHGDCIGVVGGGPTPAGDAVLNYAGRLRDGKLETLWFGMADAALSASNACQPATTEKQNGWHAPSAGTDAFERT